MLSQKHAIVPPSERDALELGLALSLALLVRTMPARPALRFLLTTYPHLFKREPFSLERHYGAKETIN